MKQLPLRMFHKITFSSHYNGTPCWVWTGCKLKGYGIVGFDGKSQRVHRLVYELLVGPIPEGLILDHLCRNRSCCNPTHLEPVTQGENVRRGNTGINHSNKTHCPQGHPYTPENTWFYRNCRACKQCQKDYRNRRKNKDNL